MKRTTSARAAKTPKPRATARTRPESSASARAEDALARLKRLATKRTLDGMARYALPRDKAFGVSVGDIKALARQLGPDHDLAVALWSTGWFEARMLAVFVDEPERVTAAQMERWCRDFDNWGLCDTACFALFDRTPHAWAKLTAWAGQRDEYVKRAAFALLWSLTVHDKQAQDAAFLRGLKLIEREAGDERGFVKKAVNMALRAVGKRNRALHVAAVALARKLAESSDATERWVGKDALRELTSASVRRRLAARRKAE